MLTIGITGGIGSGKSTIAKIVECLGFPVYYADERGKYITENDPLVLQGIKDSFGLEVFNGNQLDRPALAKIVFSDAQKLQQLNRIVHPAVKQDYEMWLAEQKTDMVFSEIAILFESGRYKDFDQSILVTAPEALRIERVGQRSGLSSNEIKARMANQWSDEQKKKLANFVVNNDEKLPLIPQVIEVVNTLRLKA